MNASQRIVNIKNKYTKISTMMQEFPVRNSSIVEHTGLLKQSALEFFGEISRYLKDIDDNDNKKMENKIYGVDMEVRLKDSNIVNLYYTIEAPTELSAHTKAKTMAQEKCGLILTYLRINVDEFY